MDYQITGIVPDRSDPDRSIDQFKAEGLGWLTLDGLLQRMVNGDRFWVAGPPSAWLERVPGNAYRRTHVRTVPDGKWDNNLYALPRYEVKYG